MFAVRAVAVDGRNSAAVTAGYTSCGRDVLQDKHTTPHPQESGRLEIAIDTRNHP